MKIEKSKGITAGEKKVAQICEKSFLSLWSYPNLFYKTNKELCDVLIVFGDIVFLISEKTSEFKPEDKDLAIEWGRFKRNIIEKSYRQLYGAEKWLKSFPTKIYMDAACTKPFPLNISKNTKFIKISVINGLDKINKIRDSAEETGIEIPADMQLLTMRIDNYIHLLDDYTFPILFEQLDTASDLISYFIKKENLLQSGKLLFIPPESDLLVMFLSNFDNDTGEHCFIPNYERFDTIVIDNPEDPYTFFSRREDVKRQGLANRNSYLWDSIVENYNHTLMDDKLIGDVSFEDKVKISRIMSQENRYFRRILSEKLLAGYSTFKSSIERRVMLMQSPTDKELAYACIMLRKNPDETKEDYKKKASVLIELYAKTIKMRFPHYKKILCFTKTFPVTARENIYFFLFESELSDMDKKYVKECEVRYGIGRTFTPVMFRHSPEYPQKQEDLTVSFSKKIPVNSKCPCGSGRKYKKCCGRLS